MEDGGVEEGETVLEIYYMREEILIVTLTMTIIINASMYCCFVAGTGFFELQG